MQRPSHRIDDIEADDDDGNGAYPSTPSKTQPITQLRFKLSQRPPNGTPSTTNIRPPPIFSVNQNSLNALGTSISVDAIEDSEARIKSQERQFGDLDESADIWPASSQTITAKSAGAVDTPIHEDNRMEQSPLLTNQPTSAGVTANMPQIGPSSNLTSTPPTFRVSQAQRNPYDSPLLGSNKRPDASPFPQAAKKSKKNHPLLNILNQVLREEKSDYRLWQHSTDHLNDDNQKTSRLIAQTSQPDMVVKISQQLPHGYGPHLITATATILKLSRAQNNPIISKGSTINIIVSLVMLEQNQLEQVKNSFRQFQSSNTESPPILSIFRPWYTTIPNTASPIDVGSNKESQQKLPTILISRFKISSQSIL